MISWLRRGKNRNLIIQAIAVISVLYILISAFLNVRTSLDELGITSGFSFLQRATGWDMSYALIGFNPDDTYARAFMVGFINTIFAGSISVILATIFGTLIGVARISDNLTLRIIGTSYVEIFRNVPLLLQALLWYGVFTHAPRISQAEPHLFGFYLTAKGLYVPTLQLSGTALVICLLLSVLIVALFLRVQKLYLNSRGIVGFVLGWFGCLFALVATFLLVSFVTKEAGTSIISFPEPKGLRMIGGTVLVPELSALIFALVFFGTSYIAEIVRGGFLSVPKGQIEAARALGLGPATIYRDIRIPLALRAIVPPLGNQYIWLIKGTTIGLAVGFSDLFMVASNTINQSGQTIEALLIMMGLYLAMNYLIGQFTNFFNKRIALKGHA